MKLVYSVLTAAVILAFALSNTCFAADNVFVTEVHLSKETVSPTEPIIVSFAVKNMGDNQIPLWADTAPYPGKRITYQLHLFCMSPWGASPSQFASGDMPLPSTSKVPAHSSFNIWTFDLRKAFTSPLPKLEPGIYRVIISGNWGGLATTYYSSEADFVVEESQNMQSVLTAIDNVNTNVAYTQDKVSETKAEVLTNRTILSEILALVKNMLKPPKPKH